MYGYNSFNSERQKWKRGRTIPPLTVITIISLSSNKEFSLDSPSYPPFRLSTGG